MAFEFTQEQETLKDMLRAFFLEKCSAEIRRARIENSQSFPLWRDLEALGLTEALTEDPESGFGELAILAFEIGRALVPERISEHITAMRSIPKERHAELGIVTVATKNYFAPVLPDAEHVVRLEAQPGLYKIEKQRDELKNSIDVLIPVLIASSTGSIPYEIGDLETLSLTISLVRASELSGILDAVLAQAVEYVSTREQFGVPIGGFQAIQQKLAAVASHNESLQALAFFSAWCLDFDKQEAEKSVRAALLYALDHVIPGIEDCLQAQGGIAFTWEYDLHLYLRRALFLSQLIPSGVQTELLAKVG